MKHLIIAVLICGLTFVRNSFGAYSIEYKTSNTLYKTTDWSSDPDGTKLASGVALRSGPAELAFWLTADVPYGTGTSSEIQFDLNTWGICVRTSPFCSIRVGRFGISGTMSRLKTPVFSFPSPGSMPGLPSSGLKYRLPSGAVSSPQPVLLSCDLYAHSIAFSAFVLISDEVFNRTERNTSGSGSESGQGSTDAMSFPAAASISLPIATSDAVISEAVLFAGLTYLFPPKKGNRLLKDASSPRERVPFAAAEFSLSTRAATLFASVITQEPPGGGLGISASVRALYHTRNFGTGLFLSASSPNFVTFGNSYAADTLRAAFFLLGEKDAGASRFSFGLVTGYGVKRTKADSIHAQPEGIVKGKVSIQTDGTKMELTAECSGWGLEGQYGYPGVKTAIKTGIRAYTRPRYGHLKRRWESSSSLQWFPLDSGKSPVWKGSMAFTAYPSDNLTVACTATVTQKNETLAISCKPELDICMPIREGVSVSNLGVTFTIEKTFSYTQVRTECSFELKYSLRFSP